MLKTRVITAVVLLALLLAILSFDSFPVFVAAAALLFAAAAWESGRLFGSKNAIVSALVWTAAFIFFAFSGAFGQGALLYILCFAAWGTRLAPSLGIGLPSIGGVSNRLLAVTYGFAIFGCFGAMLVLWRHSALYLVSVMIIVWIADTGAYFAGRKFGKHKLAPTISPGKTWEGAIGGWVAVLAITSFSTLYPLLSDTFAVEVQSRLGWFGLVVVMTVLAAASIAGDLFESQLKRRAGMKDSSHLLPGHGGVLDRIDALIPVLPLAALFDVWL